MKDGVLWNIKWQKRLGGKPHGEEMEGQVVVPRGEGEQDFLAAFPVISCYVERSNGVLLGAWPVKQIFVLVEDWTPSIGVKED